MTLEDQMQADEDVVENDETEQSLDSVNPDEGAEPSPAEEEKVVFDDRQQAKVNGLIGERVKKEHDLRRENAASIARIAELEAQVPKSQRPIVPPPPNEFDENFEGKLQAWQEATKKAAIFDANEQALQNQTLAEQKRQQLAQQQVNFDNGQKYSAAGAKLGMTQDGMAQDINKVNSHGISADLSEFIAAEGPALTQYLANNPVEVETLKTMSSMQAGAYIQSTIKPNAKVGRQPSKAPAPPDVLTGGGTPARKRGPKGAKFS